MAQLSLDGPDAFAVLDAADEKNREGNTIPLRADLADHLRNWLADKLAALQGQARQHGEPIPARLPSDAPVFTVPAGLLRILNRDAKAAGIPKRDERGRAVCLHGLRHTFGTLMSKGGVAPRTAQAAMRHSTVDLTMNVYTDPKLLDVRGALDTLPGLPLNGTGRDAAAATGTDPNWPSAFAPLFAPLTDFSSHPGAIPVKMADGRVERVAGRSTAATSSRVKRNNPLSTGDSGLSVSGRLDSNQRPHGPEDCGLAVFPVKNKHFVNRADHFPAFWFTKWFTDTM